MRRLLSPVAALGLVLAGCPIAPNNYGNDAGTVDAGNEADSGPITPTPDAGTATGSITCAISAQGDLGNTAVAGGAWAGTDLVDSVATTSDGTNYDITIEGSNANSGTLELQFGPIAVGASGVVPVADLALEGFQAGASLTVQDTWSCGPNGPCSPYVAINSFDGQTITGSFTVGFYQATSSTGSTSCSLSSGTFNVTFP